MVSSITIPRNYTAAPEFILSGFAGTINYSVVEQIKNRARFSEFTAWGVRGKIWWDERSKTWNAEVWKKTAHITNLATECIEDLAFSIQKKYGWK